MTDNQTGIELIQNELTNRDLNSFDLEQLSNYVKGELAMAAACYAYDYAESEKHGLDVGNHRYSVPMAWPFSDDSWKPENRMQCLIKAGALIVDEINRLQAEKVEA